MRIGKPGVGQEGDKGLAGVFLELTAKGGAAHGAAFHGFFEHERLGELFEHPLHHVVETWAYGGIGFGKDTGLAECDRLLRRSVVKQCEEFQQQTCACELAGGGHAIEQVDGSSRGGRSKGNTAIRRGKESLDFALAAEPAERVFIWQMELKHVATRCGLVPSSSAADGFQAARSPIRRTSRRGRQRTAFRSLAGKW